FRSVLNKSSVNIPDGIGLLHASRVLSVFKGKKAIEERLSGVDLLQDICGLAEESGRKVFLLGGKGQVSEFAAQKLKIQYPTLLVDCHEGSRDIKNQTKQELEETLNKIRDSKAEILFVGYGAPHQEIWVNDNKKTLEKIGIKVVMVVGGSYDIISGNIVRAPKWMRRFGFEWLWRLIQEPWRWRRQLRILKFLWLVLTKEVFS
ncbi:WecB/TagA/CpsF family glycosyltransferase, partial [Patescibacteria group bacterium]